ncbi:MAG: GAF domain-containing protein [Gammaproteobacteria bacterium]
MAGDSTTPSLGATGDSGVIRWLLPLLIIVCLVVLVASVNVYQDYRQQEIVEIVNNLEAIAQLKAGQMENWLQERRGDAWTLANDPLLARTVAQFLQAGPGSDAGRLLVQRLTAVRQAYHYLTIQLLDNEAHRLLSVGGAQDLTAQELEKVAQALTTRQTVFYHLHQEKALAGQPIEHEIIIPLLLTDGQRTGPVGVLYIHVDVSNFLFPLIQSWPLPSASGESLLVRREGGDVVFMNNLRFRADAAFRLRLPLAQPTLSATVALRGAEGIIEGRDYRGVDVVAAARKIAGTDWMLIAKIDHEEIYAPIRALTFNVIAVTTLLLFSIVGSFYYWQKSINTGYQLKQHQAELKRLALVKHFEYLIQYANDIILLANDDGVIIEANNRALECYQFTREELIGRNILELDTNEKSSGNDAMLSESQIGLVFESVHRRKDNSGFPVEVSLRTINIENRIYQQLIIRDITERKALGERIRRMTRALRTLSRANEILVRAGSEAELLDTLCGVIVDQAGYELAWVGYAEHDAKKTIRPAAQQGYATGYLESLFISWSDELPEGRGPAGEAIRNRTVVIIHDVQNDPRFSHWREHAAQYGFASSIALPLEIDADTTAVLNIYAREDNAFNDDEMELLKDMAANLAYGIRVQRNNKEREVIEKMLRQSQRMESIGQLAGGLAHDFNNLLGIIQGSLEILKRSISEEQEGQKWIEKALDGVRRGALLTGKMLGFSRSKASAVETYSVNGILDGMVELLRKSLTPAITIKMELRDDVWLTDIDADEFQDAVLNIVLNARDAMDAGGSLLIETSNKVLDEAYARVNPGVEPGEYVLVSVSDTGCGMSETVQARMFEPFFTTKEAGKGTGLGMSMVYGFMKRCGGQIKVYSVPGHGTTLRLYLPRSPAEESNRTAGTEDAEALPRGTEAVLVVDDEPELVEIARAYLEALGYRVRVAGSAAEALEVLDAGAGAIDLLFSDVVMPGAMDGYELAKQVTQRWPVIKVLLTSGFTDRAVEHNGLSRLQLELLDKPYTQRELAVRVRRILDNGEQRK